MRSPEHMARGHESKSERWRRRAITLPAMVLVLPVLLALLPVLLAAALLFDLLFGRCASATRLLLFAIHYAICECLGLLASLGLWLLERLQPDPERSLSRHYALQRWWAGSLFAGVRILFGVRVQATGAERLAPGPLLVFIRHTSVVDTLLPALTLSRRHRLRLRYVLKRELLWDPCLDVVGHRLPNVFVRRGSADGAAEITRVAQLGQGMKPDEGVLIYPEGTRATRARRERALERIESGDDRGRLERARRLRHVLPARIGGPLALLEAAPGTDVLLMAHVGLEDVSHLRDVLRGGLVGRRIDVRFWRLPRADIPTEREAQIRWLDAAWQRMDDWIDERRRTAQNLSEECLVPG